MTFSSSDRQQPQDQSSASEPVTRPGVTAVVHPRAHSEVSRTTEASAIPAEIPKPSVITTPTAPAKARQPLARKCPPLVSTKPAKTQEPSGRKRKVSFDGVGIAPSDNPTEGQTPAKPNAITPSTETAESSAAPKPTVVEERPKKKQKKESTKTKDIRSTETVESPATKASAPKPRKKSTTLDPGSKVTCLSQMDASAPIYLPSRRGRVRKKTMKHLSHQ